jgi:hypothetical protein
MSPIATKDGKVILKDGKAAENCDCCTSCVGNYAKFEWVDKPPPSAVVQPGFLYPWNARESNDAGFCACYWEGLPMTFTPVGLGFSDKCMLVGGVPVAGLRHSRRHIMNDYFTSARAAIGRIANQDGSLLRFNQEDYRYLLYANDKTLSVDFRSGRVAIGAHTIKTANGNRVAEGVTIPNPATGSAEYKYKISSATAAECDALWSSQVGRSLQDCGGKEIFSPTRKWKVSVDVDYSKAGYSSQNPQTNFNARVAGFVGSWGFSKSVYPVQAGNVPPFGFAYVLNASDTPAVVFVKGSIYIATTTNNGFAATANNPYSPPCDGCKHKYVIQAGVSKVISNPDSSPLALNAIYRTVEDNFYFSAVYSPCFSKVGNAWSITAQSHFVSFSNPVFEVFQLASVQMPDGGNICTLTITDDDS